MQAGIPDYDPRIIDLFADKLYRKAAAFLVGAVVVGAAIGSAFGAVPLTPLGDGWPIPQSFGFATLLVGGLLGSAIGYVIGDARAFGYRLQAQAALCQIQIERNTAAAVRDASASAAAASPQPPAASPQPPAAPPMRVEGEVAGNGPTPPLTPPVSSY